MFSQTNLENILEVLKETHRSSPSHFLPASCGLAGRVLEPVCVSSLRSSLADHLRPVSPFIRLLPLNLGSFPFSLPLLSAVPVQKAGRDIWRRREKRRARLQRGKRPHPILCPFLPYIHGFSSTRSPCFVMFFWASCKCLLGQ